MTKLFTVFVEPIYIILVILKVILALASSLTEAQKALRMR